MNIKIKCEDGVGQIIGKSTFPIDEFEERIYRESPLPEALDYFKQRYIDPFSKLCCQMTSLMSVNVTTVFIK